MSEVEDYGDIVQESDRNAALLLAVAVLAWAIENDEPFNVDSSIVNDVIQSNIELGTSIPELAFSVDEENRLRIGVTMHKPEEYDLEED